MRIIKCCLCAGQEQLGVEEGPHSLLGLFSDGAAGERGGQVHCAQTLPKQIITLHQESFNALKCSLQVSTLCQQLHSQITSIPPQTFVLALGGDHSLAIGSILGALSRFSGTEQLGVVWVDAHADLNSPQSSLTGRMHGCPLGLLLNIQNCREMHSEWNWMLGQPVLSPSQLTYIALRDVDEAEVQSIQQLGIKAFWMPQVQQMGINAVLKEVLGHLQECGAIHLSFDVDAVDPGEISSTGTPVAGGLSVEQAKALVEGVVFGGKVCSADIVEFNPRLGNLEASLGAVKQIFGGPQWSKLIGRNRENSAGE